MRVTLLCLISIFFQKGIAQNSTSWNGKSCAVVLTYDDALNQHLDYVIPSLDAYNLKGTFYIIGSSDCFNKRNKEWKLASKNGHELGNHTLMHPCARPHSKTPISPEKDLNNYTLKKVVSEIKETNRLLKETDGKTERSFAFPCGQKKVHDTLFYNYVKNDFVAARGVKRDLKSINEIDLDNVNAYGMKGHTATEMIGLVDEAIKNNKLLVFLFHGVGGGSPLNVENVDHQKLLKYLDFKQHDVWVAPMVEIAKYVKLQSKIIKD
ncbi:polysaccharide deacetylase family protein [Postechiella marina]|uniref:Polysaccharide deacetylase family protein n=1 Tax=Postechiella marina TaxID=943941 RepID=A0ABP8CCM7_9FLAO